MEIGLDAYCPEHLPWYRDLGVTMTKHCIDLDQLTTDAPFAAAIRSREAGLRVVLDVRVPGPVNEFLKSLGPPPSPEQEELAAQGKLRLPPSYEEFPKVCDELRSLAETLARQHAGVVNDYEVWGEAHCQVVSKAFIGKAPNYIVIMEAIAEGLHAGNPDCKVSNGGWGVDLNYEWIKPVIEDGITSIDRVCWHPYLIGEYWPRDERGVLQTQVPIHRAVHDTQRRIGTMLGFAQGIMEEIGVVRPQAVTEWGIPVVDNEYAELTWGRSAHSGAVDQAYALADWAACSWMEGMLSAFEEQGCEFVIIHRLLDGDCSSGTNLDSCFWGNYCGLIFNDGQPKAVYDVVKRWVAASNERAGITAARGPEWIALRAEGTAAVQDGSAWETVRAAIEAEVEPSKQRRIETQAYVEERNAKCRADMQALEAQMRAAAEGSNESAGPAEDAAEAQAGAAEEDPADAESR